MTCATCAHASPADNRDLVRCEAFLVNTRALVPAEGPCWFDPPRYARR